MFNTGSVTTVDLNADLAEGETLTATDRAVLDEVSSASLACGFLPRWLPIRYPMALIGVFLTLATLLMIGISSAGQGYFAASLFGLGIGGLLTLLPIAWADYFGRANFAAIRSVALSAQVLAQATGPLLSGALHDWTGN